MITMVEVNMRMAVSEIARILETAGYDCELEDGGIFNLSAVKDDKCIIVACCDDKEILQRFDMTPYTIILNKVKTRCDKIVFTTTNFIPKECELWTKEKLAQYIMNSGIARIFNEPFDIVSVPSFAYPGPVPRSLMPGYDMMLPINISEADAIRVARQDGPTVLRMIPYWHYTYVSSGEAEYKGKVVNFDDSGDGWVNAVNGLEWSFENAVAHAGQIPSCAEVVRAVKTKNDCRDDVMNNLIKKLTRHIRIKTTSGDAIFAEERDFRPNEKQIDLKFEQVFVPVWQVRGKKDIVEVNAYDGQELSLPSDEGCEVF